MNGKKRWIGNLVVALIFIGFVIFVFSRERSGNKHHCKESYKGIVTQLDYNIQEYTIVTINGKQHSLLFFGVKKRDRIKVGDHITKKENENYITHQQIENGKVEFEQNFNLEYNCK